MRTGRGNRSSGPRSVTYESTLVTTIVFDVSDSVVQTIHLIANPEKLIGVREVEVWGLRAHLRHGLEAKANPQQPRGGGHPCTWRGRPMGSAIRARARVLEGEEAAYAGRLLARKHPILHGFLVPLIHRLRGNETMHIELTPVSG
jgi:hypothetical protein